MPNGLYAKWVIIPNGIMPNRVLPNNTREEQFVEEHSKRVVGMKQPRDPNQSTVSNAKETPNNSH